MTKEEIRALWDKIGTDPILTDEEIEYIWMAMEKAVDEEEIWFEEVEIKMKPEEAYNLIELCLDYDKDMSERPERYEMALQIARDVFYKQTPEKPVYDPRYAEKRCATCLERVTFQTWKHGYPVTIKMNYCQNCGQKLDWSEE